MAEEKERLTPTARDLSSAIVKPPIPAATFEINPSLILLVQQLRFTGSTTEDPHSHIVDFLDLCDTVKIDGASDDAVRLRLFPFSLADKAKRWLRSVPPGSISTWEELVSKFLDRSAAEAGNEDAADSSCSTLVVRNETATEEHHLYELVERVKDIQMGLGVVSKQVSELQHRNLQSN